MPPEARGALVEAVARAIHTVALRNEKDSLKPSGWDDEHPIHKDELLKQATAAIAAYERALADAGMVIVPREAPQKAIEAFWQAPDPTPYLPYAGPEPVDAYRFMIAAAAKTKG